MVLMNYRPLGSSPEDPRLGRYIPDTDRHIREFRASEVLPQTVGQVEKTLFLPTWHWSHDQGAEGSCVGHGTAMERAISNSTQNKLLLKLRISSRRYDPIWFWDRAKERDEWPETNPGDDNGTSVHAAYDVARTLGARRIKLVGGIVLGSDGRPIVRDQVHQSDPSEGVQANRWATTVDEMRTCIALGIPVVIGVNWYSDFDRPVEMPGRAGMWVAPWGISGRIRGGHCICIYGASDKYEGFKFKNSWGRDYPLAFLPYAAMTRLLREDGEATIVTDR
jgi:hypothetical protein